MNTGAEAVETAIKAAAVGYVVKKIPENQAEIITAEATFMAADNGHQLLTETEYRKNFVPSRRASKCTFDDIKRSSRNHAQYLRRHYRAHTSRRYQCRARIPERSARAVRQAQYMMILDEVQSGLGRTGKKCLLPARECKPDAIILARRWAEGFCLFPPSSHARIMDCSSPAVMARLSAQCACGCRGA